jgi:hypothetical protein
MMSVKASSPVKVPCCNTSCPNYLLGQKHQTLSAPAPLASAPILTFETTPSHSLLPNQKIVRARHQVGKLQFRSYTSVTRTLICPMRRAQTGTAQSQSAVVHSILPMHLEIRQLRVAHMETLNVIHRLVWRRACLTLSKV